MIVSPQFERLLLVPTVVIVGSLLLSGCGRKAEPELPSAVGTTETRPVGIPIAPVAPKPRAEPEKKSFFLDFLL